MKSLTILIAFLFFLFVACTNNSDNNKETLQKTDGSKELVQEKPHKNLSALFQSKKISYRNRDTSGCYIYDHTFTQDFLNRSLSRIYGRYAMDEHVDLVIVERKPADNTYTEPIITIYSYYDKEPSDKLDIYETKRDPGNRRKRFMADQSQHIRIYTHQTKPEHLNTGKDTMVYTKTEEVYKISSFGQFILIKHTSRGDVPIDLKRNKITNKYLGVFSASVETESTTTGMASIEYTFSIKRDDIELTTNTYHEPIQCNGTYYVIEKDQVLELYFMDVTDVLCNYYDAGPAFSIKEENGELYAKGLGAEGTFREWIKLKKEQ